MLVWNWVGLVQRLLVSVHLLQILALQSREWKTVSSGTWFASPEALPTSNPGNSKAVSKLVRICFTYLSAAQLPFSPPPHSPTPTPVLLFSLLYKFSKMKGNRKVFHWTKPGKWRSDLQEILTEEGC